MTDGSNILYAHLKQGSTIVSAGQAVKQGDVLGQADSTGGVTGPHLHLEYAPGGDIYAKTGKIDPYPCIGSTVIGSISVGDNGPLADDAFNIIVDGINLGTTTVGRRNLLALNNLRPANHMLSIVCVVAPDNDGTLGVAFSNGWTFSDGADSVSADMRLDQTLS